MSKNHIFAIMNLNKFFVTPLGSYVKVFLSAVITVYVIELTEGHDIFTFNKEILGKLLTAGAVAVLPVVHSALNPKDTRFGKKEGPKPFTPEKN